MQPSALRALEFDRIVEAVGDFSLTPMGAERLERLQPSTDARTVAQLLAATTETTRYIDAHGVFPLRATADLPQILTALAVEGRALEALRLLALANFLDSIDESRAGIGRAPGTFPLLEATSGGAASFRTETAHAREKIDPSGEVVDSASPELRIIRDRLRKQRTRLRSTLESYLRGKDTAKYLQDQVVTERNGRYVLVVKAEHRSGIPGIVHGTSTSGASLFLEPLSTVEINNDIVALEEQEAEEVRRILLALTDAFRQRAGEMQRTIEAATELDVLQARARFSNSIDGIEPELSTDGWFELQAARHPLLKSPVPVTIKVIPPATILLVTGPNTGGKTVALKAFGLLALMAQAGLLIPAEPGSRFTPFKSVFADIGDEQSIAASLSTFSAHLANLVRIERELELPALVLLDEVGGGTDPIEGGALGAAVVDHFRRRGALVVATTHDDAMKSYAATTEGAEAAAFGFNPDTYAPTYRLIYGAPGRSLALEIAERLGMPAGVIADARARRSGRESLLAAHLSRVDKELVAVEQEKQRAVAERETLTAERRALHEREARLTEREAVLKRRLDDKLNERLREARAEVDAVVTRLKTRADALADAAGRRSTARAPVLSTGEVGELRTEARSALGAIGEAIAGGEPAEANAEAFTAAPEIGQIVFVTSLGADGIVRSVSGNRIEVEVRGMRTRVKLGELRRSGPRTPGPKEARGRMQDPIARPKRGGVDITSRAVAELVLIGTTVDDALDRAEKFLDTALLGEERRLRVVHGHGTGRLRDALRTFFKTHPLVATVAPAPDNEGGNAATIVELKD